MRSTPLAGLAVALVLMPAAAAATEITSAQVNTAIFKGVEYLEQHQGRDGNWKEILQESSGVTALCTLALLS
jgi:hypothetical protein